MTYLIYGEDYFGVDQALAALRRRYRARFGEVNITQLDAQDLTVERFRADVQAIPFGQTHRLVILKAAFSTLPKEHHAALAATITQIPRSTVVLFVEYGVPLTASPLYQALHQPGKTLVSHALAPLQLRRWVQAVVLKEEITISPLAVNHLVRSFGDDRWRLYHELQKCLLYAQANALPTIDDGVIAEVVVTPKQLQRFATSDALIERNRKKFLAAIADGVDDLFPILGGVVATARALVLATQDSTNLQARYLKALGIHPFVGVRAKEGARRFRPREAHALFTQLGTLDWEIKTGAVEAEIGLLQWGVQYLSPRP